MQLRRFSCASSHSVRLEMIASFVTRPRGLAFTSGVFSLGSAPGASASTTVAAGGGAVDGRRRAGIGMNPFFDRFPGCPMKLRLSETAR